MSTARLHEMSMTPGQRLAMTLAGIGVASMLLLGMFLPRSGSVETVMMASVTWVPQSLVPVLEEEYWSKNRVPLCSVLAKDTIKELNVEAEPVACLLKVVK